MFKVLRLCMQLNPAQIGRSQASVNIRTSAALGNISNFFSKDEKSENLPRHCDVLVIGGGCMGSSIAYWLKQRALEGLSVVVVERDPTYQQCTTVLSVGGLRQQFSLKENIELSLDSAEFLRNIKVHLKVKGQEPPDIQFQPSGYVFLATEKSVDILEDNVKLQRSLGAKVDLLTPEQLKKKFPWLNTENIALGSHGLENEGWFDPYSLLFAFKNKAVNLGAKYVCGDLERFLIPENKFSIEKEGCGHQINGAVIKLKDGTEHTIKFAVLVIAAGGCSGEVAKKVGIGTGTGDLAVPLPVEPRKRYVFNIHCPEGPGISSPMIIDPSGAYFRREGLGGHYLCGISPPDEEEPLIDNLDVDYSFFEEKLWPILAHRCPAFENAKLKSAWAGFYDYNKFDENAFIGIHPAFINVYMATGFSGHGIQQSPAIGKAIMELIIDGKYVTIDLERLSFKRLFTDEPLYESNIV
ncbi:FAD-dependent oxidoreductase domain-containing protein 1 isoform X2 [Halyomorpha halys]|uniref:FAD-dependent oxidoreductase domain-containing protein 1 isoform X2 n=1 Tax=Halyomorpha halys TaxID=286706 RepID=UPI0006D4DCAE|nr:FAD-dependent oxidoreductase domain-containing protein 1 isoform X2 [Halyomorpha halys]